MVGVVWIHSAQSETFRAGIDWCRFAVPAFTGISVFLLVARHGAEANPGFAFARSARLYALFLCWNGFYAVSRVLEHRLFVGGDKIRWGWETLLLAGFAEQLWFLPFLAVATVIVILPAWTLSSFTKIRNVRLASTLILAGAGLATAAIPSPILVNLEAHPATYWAALSWAALPSAFLAAGLASIAEITDRRNARTLGAIVALVLAVTCLSLARHSRNPSLLQNGAGVLLVASALAGPQLKSAEDQTRWLGTLTLPIYLLHVVFVHGSQALARRLGLQVSAWLDASAILFGIVGSIFLGSFIRQSRYQWLVTLKSKAS